MFQMKIDISDSDYVAYLLEKWDKVLTPSLSGCSTCMIIESQEQWIKSEE
jgi:hypothetical protein